MILHQGVRCLGRADEGEDVDEACLHARGHGVPTPARDKVHDACREARCIRLHCEAVSKSTSVWDLHHHSVAHQESRDQSGIGLVKWIVGRAKVHHDSHRGSFQQCMHTLLAHQTLRVEAARGRDQRADEVHGAVELLRGICVVLADLPLEDAHDLRSLGFERCHELFDRSHTLFQRPARPISTASTPGFLRSLHRLDRLLW
mmetsp:Transcript_30366/g.48642  ORF Transcript_30366/g.48642 Transcript_30366/m.48642 type:complete len:202 (-) Transcript_30366:331-936(-)